ncbi:MAG: terpene cyclase/mutase family protein [Candidatus Solibacter usitatus]|nr:terpene cyclase/mutase family protein [Candidatus Solibacter usitatus]
MALDFRQTRIELLLRSQNADGGWGYFAGRQSWLEPTCYSLLALHTLEEGKTATERGWKFLRARQRPSGGFSPNALVPDACWATSLCVTLHAVRGEFDAGWKLGVEWLLASEGAEGTWLERAINLVRPLPVEYDRRFKGWPWLPGTSSWVEPTAHAIVALKKVPPHSAISARAQKRIEEAERMLMDRRSTDGGWNYGNRRVLKTNLPSYPETTGIALTGLQGSKRWNLQSAVDAARKEWPQTQSSLAKAWLAIALRNAGDTLPAPEPLAPGNDLMAAALEAMACPQGGHQWLTAG